jgi:hypothetical protein
MLRKSVTALAAVATIGAAALTPAQAGYKGKYKYKYIAPLVIGTAIVVTSAAVASSCWRYGWYRGAYVRWWVCD